MWYVLGILVYWSICLSVEPRHHRLRAPVGNVWVTSCKLDRCAAYPDGPGTLLSRGAGSKTTDMYLYRSWILSPSSLINSYLDHLGYIQTHCATARS